MTRGTETATLTVEGAAFATAAGGAVRGRNSPMLSGTLACDKRVSASGSGRVLFLTASGVELTGAMTTRCFWIQRCILEE